MRNTTGPSRNTTGPNRNAARPSRNTTEPSRNAAGPSRNTTEPSSWRAKWRACRRYWTSLKAKSDGIGRSFVGRRSSLNRIVHIAGQLGQTFADFFDDLRLLFIVKVDVGPQAFQFLIHTDGVRLSRLEKPI